MLEPKNIDEPVKCYGVIVEPEDKKKLHKLFFQWKELNEELKAIGTRGINLHESISERDLENWLKVRGV